MTHAADRAVERDVAEVVFGGLDLLGVFLALVAQGGDIGMAVDRVGVERDLGVEALQVAVCRDDQRVDLQHCHILGDERLIELGDDLAHLLGLIAFEPKRLGDGAAMMGLHAGRGIDGEGGDALGMVVRDILDVHAALGRDDEGDAAGLAVDEDRQVELLGDSRAVLDVDAVDLPPGRPGLHRHQRVPEDLPDVLRHLFDGFDDAHAALRASRGLLEGALAASAGMDLRLDHPHRAAELLGSGFRLFRLEHRHAARYRHAELTQHGFGLVFVDVHREAPVAQEDWLPEL